MAEGVVGLIIFATAALVSFGLTPWIRVRALRGGRVDRPGGRKTQEAAVPYGGGLVLLLAVGFTLGLGLLVAVLTAKDLDLVARHLDGLLVRAPTLAAIGFGAATMWFMGRLDDRRPLAPGLRFLIQLLAVLPLALSDQRLTLFIPSPALQVGVACLWLVFITNAANFIDNMDGLLTGVALIATAGFAALAALFGQLFVCAFALTLAGALSGLLPHNRRPARVYLGDEGSMPLGFLLGSLAMVTSYRGGGDPVALPFVVPIGILIVPILDGGVAIGGRLLRGVAPWTAGRDHLSHRLVARGFSPRAAVRLLQGLGALGAALALTTYLTRSGGLPVALAFALLAGIRLVGGLRGRSCP